MAKYSNTIEYNISTKLDSKGLTQLQQQLKQIEISIQKMDNAGSLNSKIADARTQIKGLGNALSEAFNPSLGMVDLAKFNTALKENGVSAVELRNAFQLAGADGQVAFNNLVGQLGQLDLGLKRSSSSLNKIATTFGNTFRWGVIASFFSQFMNAIHSSVDYVKELDDSLTQIMLVTDYNRDSMNAYAKAANEAAKAVGQTTVGMTNASLIFAQQGYDLGQSQELATLSAKLANASQQDTATTSDQITAYMNAYGLSNSIEDLSAALDSWALVANVSAADVAELATASQKAASTANSVGVNMDQLNAQIATIESVTRDAPEQIGNGLKTLYARFSDIKLGKTLEDGVNLGQVTGQLNKLGVQVLDQFGNIRDVGDILEDLMVIWDDLDQTTKEASAQTLAGKFQMNRFLALMDNSDMYREYLGASENAEGTLDQMNEEYLDSLEGRTAKIQASLEGIFSSIFDTDVVYPFIDAMQKFLDILQTLIDSLGGGSTIILGLVSALTQLFSNQIAQGINDFNINQAISKQRQENYQNSAATLNGLGAINPNPNDENSQAILNYARKMNEMQPYLSQDQAKQANEILIEMIAHTNDLTKAQQEYNDQMSKVGAIASATFDDKLMAPFEQEDAVNYQMLSEELKNWNNILEGSGEKIAQTKEEWKEFQDTLQTQNIQIITEKWQELENIFGGTPFGEKVKAELEKIKAGSTDANESLADLTGGAQRLLELLESYKSGDLRAEDFIKELEKLDQLNANVEMKKSTVEGTQKVAGAVEQGIDSQQQIKQIVDTVGALGQLAFAIQSVQNIGSIWKNEDLTTGEKILQTIINLSMVIPGLINGVKALETAWGLTKMAKVAAATEIVTAAKKHEEEVTWQLTAAENALRIAQEHGKDEKAAELITRITELRKKLKMATDESTAAEIGLTAAENGQGIAAIFAAKATELLNKALTALNAHPEIFAITAVLTAAGILLGTIIAKINQIRQDAEDAYQESISNLEKIKDLQQSISDFNDKYASFKETGEGGKDLVETAENLALALKEAGAEEEAQKVHLAALRAEAAGTEASYEALSNTINEANQTASNNAYLDTINASAKILQLEGRTLEEVISKEQELKQAQEDLANLDPFASNYEAQRRELENLIATLKNTIDQTQEATEAAHALMDAQGELAGNTLANVDGMNLGVVGDKDFEERAATLDFFAMRDYFSETVDGFNLLSDLEQVDFILQHVDTDAEKAAAKMQQLLLANENLSYGWDDAAGGIEKTDDYVEVTQSLEKAGFNAEQSLQLIATLDENATMEEIQAKIQEVQANMDANGGDFSLALSTSLDTDQDSRELTQQLFSEMAPTDADVDADSFQQLGRYFAEIAENDPFDDIPDELAYSAEALADFTEAILRYDSAVEKAEKSMDHWREVLEDSDASSLDMAEVTDELANVYADLLDLPFDNLSRDFTSDINNLNDLEAAVNGDEEAYNRLMSAAQEDITAQFAVQVDGNEEAEAALARMNAELATLIDQDWTVNPDVDTTAFIEALNSLIDSGAVTAEQVQAYLGSMGMEATMESETETQETPVVATGVKAVQDDPIELKGTLPIGNADGSSFGSMGVTTTPYKASIPQFHYEAVETDATQVASMTGFALTTTSGNTTSGGHITSINKKSSPSGGTKAKHASRPSGGGGGGGHRGGGGGHKGGGGGGRKGSSPKTIEPKEKKEHEKDYYEEVNSQLDKTEKILSRIEKEEDRLIGDKARANQNKQLTLLQKEIKLNEEKLKINKQELKDTDDRLKQQDKLAEQILKQQGISMNIPNPVFDEDGVIANFEQINKALDDAHNKLIDKYNAAAKAGNEELTKEIEKQISKFDDYSKNLLDAAKRHDTLQSEIEETTNALEDLKDAIEDIQIAAYKAGIEAGEKFEDIVEEGAELQGFFRDFDPGSFINSFSIDERPYERLIEDLYKLENLYNQNEEAANRFYDAMIAKKKEDLKNATSEEERQAIQTSIQYFEDELNSGAKNQLNYWSNRLEELQRWWENPKAIDNPFGENIAELADVYDNVKKAAREAAENNREYIQDYRDTLLDIYDEFDDSLDRQFDKYDDLLDKVEQMADVYTLYYGEDSYNELANILQREGEILQSELNEQANRYKEAEEAYQQALMTGDKKTIEAMEDRMRDAEKEMRDTAEQLAETWVKQFETSINRSTQQMTQNVWGRNDLEELSDNWELEKQYIEDYKDEVEKAYEIDKLRSKYIDLLNNAQGASLATQNKIRQEMQDQLNYLENQATVSEYDVKLANAKLEILQKQIALEDAQRNKNRMQLRRDTQGNYRYVYRADDDDIKQAQDELLESSYDIYEITKDQTITNNDRMISSFLDFQEKARNIAEKYKDDEVARQAALNDLAEQYKKTWAALGEDFGDVTNGMYDVLWWNINNLIGDSADASLEKMNQLYDENGNIKEKTGEQWRDLATEIQNNVIDKVYDSAINCITDINVSGQRLASNIAGSLDVIGAGVDSLDISLAEATDATRNLKEATDDLFAAFNGDNAQINNAMKMISDYRAELEKTQNSASNLAQQLTEANKRIANLTAKNTAYKTSINNSPSKRTGSSGSSSGGGSSSSGGSRGSSSGGGSKSGGSSGSGSGSSGRGSGTGYQSVGTKGTSGNGKISGYNKSSAKALFRKIFKGDTGGYTGDWNEGIPGTDNGRWAILHQKELVLNAKDTENILGAVTMMRGMVSAIQTGALSKSISSSINNANKSFGDTIEQRVEISATFPAVTNSNEIEAALLGLSDKAYQYSYRTR